MIEPLSCYILTLNSERYLASIIAPIREVIDDLVIVDSGSTDRTKEIAAQFNARFLVREIDNFNKQRRFALEACQHQWVLSLDSDEVPDATFAISLAELKATAFALDQKQPDAFRINRRWFVLGQEIHAFYPITSPDHPVRLLRKDKMTFEKSGRGVHESPRGAGNLEIGVINGTILHYSCDSVQKLYEKLNLYTRIAAEDLKRKGVKGSWSALFTHPIGAWLRWYILKKGWKDGWIGWLLGHYAYEYTYQKYLKLLYNSSEEAEEQT